MLKKRMRPLAYAIVMLMLAAPIASERVLIYKSDACSHCAPYLQQLFPVLQNAGIAPDQIEVRDFINNPERRKEVALLQEKYNVPLTMQGHMLTIIDEKIVLEGHVPLRTVQSLLAEKPSKSIIAFQDSMASEVASYELLADGKRFECSVEQKPAECIKGGAEAQPNDLQKLLLPALLVGVAVVLIVKYGFGK